MKNMEASVGVVPTQEQKARGVEEIEEEEEYHQMRNEMIFCLEEAPEYQISAVAEWAENSQGDVVVGADTYFRHVMTGQRCESVRDCFDGWSEIDEKSTEMWETLCERIENIDNIDEYICDEKSVEL